MARAPKQQQRKAKSKEDAALAVKLRARGLTLDQIAAQIGHKNKSSVSRLIDRELDRTPVEGLDRLRKLEMTTLARLQRRVDELIDSKDSALALEAVRTQLGITQQKAKICGFNAPVRAEVLTTTSAALDKDVSALSDEDLDREHAELTALGAKKARKPR